METTYKIIGFGEVYDNPSENNVSTEVMVQFTYEDELITPHNIAAEAVYADWDEATQSFIFIFNPIISFAREPFVRQQLKNEYAHLYNEFDIISGTWFNKVAHHLINAKDDVCSVLFENLNEMASKIEFEKECEEA